MSEPTTPQDIKEARLADLRAKAKAREGKPGYAANVEAIKAEIARLEKETNDG